MSDRATPELLAEYFNYNPETGVIVWKKASGNSRTGDIAGGFMSKGYRNIYFMRKTLKAHIVAWVLVNGRYPINFIDHRNGDRSDNRIVNLREADGFQNAQNAKKRKDNSSGVKGVYFHSQSQMWTAQIKVGNKQITLGRFKEKNQAKEARRSAANQLHKEYARHQ
jgi:hypothetical protein